MIYKQFSKKKKKSSGYNKDMGKSMTVPDQNLTIGELLDRHSRGVPLGAPQLKGEYFDTEIPKFDDLTDALEYKKDLEKKKAKLDELLKKNQFNKVKAKVKPLNEESEVEDSQAEKVSEDKPTKEAPQ